MVGYSISLDSDVQDLANVEDFGPLNTLDRGLSDILLSNVLILELDDEGLELFVLSNIDNVLLRRTFRLVYMESGLHLR
jgi:hypothetical protein